MDLNFYHDNKEQRFRVIRFFCRKLDSEDFAHEINEEKKNVILDFDQKVQEIEDALEKRRLEIGEESVLVRKKPKMIQAFLGILAVVISITLVSPLNIPGVPLNLAIAALVVTAIAVISLSLILKYISKKDSGKMIKVKKQKDEDISRLKKERDTKLSKLSMIVDNLLAAWENAKATEEEVFNYINNIILKELGPKINDFLDIQDNDVEDEHCAEIWTPLFMQSEILPLPVEIDIERSKRDIYLIRDEVIQPLKQAFPVDLSWDSFSNQILQKINLADSNDLKLSAYNAVHYYDKKKAYLAGSYFYQKIICTEDFVSQFRCYVNVLCDRVAFTQAIQIHYADISAIRDRIFTHLGNII